MTVLCPIWLPIEWSRCHPHTPVPFKLWLLWHAANLLPPTLEA